MTKREQILVIAMTGAVVWGAASLVMGYMRNNDGAAILTGERMMLRTFAESQRTALDEIRLAGREKMVLNEALEAWAGSPFLAEAPRARPAEERTVTFHYTGHLKIGKRQFAIINGREYRESDPVHATDFVVESIAADHVVLAAVSGGRRVTVDLQPSNLERKSP